MFTLVEEVSIVVCNDGVQTETCDSDWVPWLFHICENEWTVLALTLKFCNNSSVNWIGSSAIPYE